MAPEPSDGCLSDDGGQKLGAPCSFPSCKTPSFAGAPFCCAHMIGVGVKRKETPNGAAVNNLDGGSKEAKADASVTKVSSPVARKLRNNVLSSTYMRRKTAPKPYVKSQPTSRDANGPLAAADNRPATPPPLSIHGGSSSSPFTPPADYEDNGSNSEINSSSSNTSASSNEGNKNSKNVDDKILNDVFPTPAESPAEFFSDIGERRSEVESRSGGKLPTRSTTGKEGDTVLSPKASDERNGTRTGNEAQGQETRQGRERRVRVHEPHSGFEDWWDRQSRHGTNGGVVTIVSPDEPPDNRVPATTHSSAARDPVRTRRLQDAEWERTHSAAAATATAAARRVVAAGPLLAAARPRFSLDAYIYSQRQSGVDEAETALPPPPPPPGVVVPAKAEMAAAAAAAAEQVAFLSACAPRTSSIPPARCIYAHMDPRVHWVRPRSSAWHAAKNKEIRARGGRKANVGKAAVRMASQRRIQRDGLGVAGNAEVPSPASPTDTRLAVAKLSVWEGDLPSEVQCNDSWMRVLGMFAHDEDQLRQQHANTFQQKQQKGHHH
ncbi:hypothetical protein SPI_00883 [Niveomyces insectorum RCEF 264]|uniref:Uncharacterized protein n=1 Tax=Niveomyces insectorum RCEF 264 TaxID=1081102 RepID=A0A168AG07_9HYPO|nr:hypothetical protein SPI_00883 [Niveomyces insectorum RCEF 264]